MDCNLALWLLLSALLYQNCSSSVLQQSAHRSFSNSLRLTRSVRARAQQLLQRYNKEQFGDSLFEDRRLVLNTLPSITIKYRSWLQMEDSERLSSAFHDLNTFWTHLESQRKQLEMEMEEGRESDGVRINQKRNRRGRPQLSLPQSMLGIQLDLRDLIRQVNSQLANMKVFKQDPTTHTSTFSSPTQPTPTQSPLTIAEEHPSTTDMPPQTSYPITPSSASTSGPIASIPGPHSALSHILASTPWDTAATTKERRTTFTSTEAASSSEEVTQASMVTVESKAKLTTQVFGPSRWVSRLEGYVILRDLERYLSKLVRDYTLLRAKYQDV